MDKAVVKFVVGDSDDAQSLVCHFSSLVVTVELRCWLYYMG